MNKQVLHDDILNAYIDGDLDIAARQRLLNAMHADPELRKRVCELQEAKAWVSVAFADATPPETTRPSGRYQHQPWYGRAAAVLLLVTLGFSAGWLTHPAENNNLNSVILKDVAASNNRVLLHISEGNKEKFAEVLDETEYLLKTYRKQGIQVEVLANADGLNLLRADISPYAQRVAHMIVEYPNLKFIACANAIQRAKERGEDVVLLDHVNSQPTAIDHAIERLREGWAYIQI